jgi:rubredoxin
MKRETFAAGLAVLVRQWPFGEGAAEKEAQRDYSARLRLRVARLSGEDEAAFVLAIEEFVGGERPQFARPSVDQIANRVFAKSGGRGRHEENPTRDRRQALYFDLRAFLLNGWLDAKSSVEHATALLGCTETELREFWEKLLKWRACPACEFGIALVLGGGRKFRHYRCESCGHLYRVERDDPTPVAFDGPAELTSDEVAQREAAKASKWSTLAKKIGTAPRAPEHQEEIPF